MKNRTQTLITVILMLLFLGSVPLVLLNTAGYRINLRTRQLERTGILILRSTPPEAHILLDGVRQNERTPARLSQLLPREYRVTVEREGYRPWSKLLSVESQRSTFAEDIVLFPDQLPVRVADVAASTLAISEDGTLAYDHAVGTVSEIRLRTPEGEETVATRIGRTGNVPPLLSWSPSGDWLLVAAAGDDAPTQLSRSGVENRQIPLPGPLMSAAWVTGIQESPLLVAAGNAYLAPDSVPFATSTAAAWFQSGTTFLARAATGTIRIDAVAANGQLLRRDLASLPVGTYAFLPSPPGRLTVLGERRIRVFDATDGTLRLDRPATGATWRTDGVNELLIWTDFELWTAGDDGNATLLTRLGAPIRGAAWYPGGTHVLYTSGDAVAAIERDDRGGRIITPLFTLPDLGAFIVDEKGAAVFATAAPAGKPGIFRYPILIP